MISRWFTSVRIFFVWLLGFVLALVILALFHELLMVFLVTTLRLGSNIIRLINILYYCSGGLLCVGYYLFIEEYLNRAAHKGRLFYNAIKTIGIQLLIISLIQLCLVLYGFFPADWLSIGAIVIACGLGMTMLYLAHHNQHSIN
jgi:hypothetical protein